MYIIVRDVNKTYGKHQVLNSISVGFLKGKIHGVVGRNGSGKTQLFKVICGYVIPDSGSVKVAGKIIGKDRDYPDSMGLLIENPGFLTNYTGLFNLQMLAAMNTKLKKDDLVNLMKEVGLADAINKKVRKYSLGMKQRLGIAQALMGNPELIILDEPFNGLDKTGVEDVRKMILSLKEKGKTIMLASHNPYDIEVLCDTIHEMDAGRIMEIK
ncbi:MAG: ATP-binding cassette domain-containing protein [Clostridiaceae bacterium]|nr:ATP-binding cassette domain-containing protein [Clostridiaceae bacterium]